MTTAEQALLDYVTHNHGAGRGEIRGQAAPHAHETTVWRTLRGLVDAGHLEVMGKGRSTGYRVAGPAAVRAHLRIPYQQRPPARYKPEFLDAYIPGKTFYLPEASRQQLRQAGTPIGQAPAGTYARRILEQLLVDLSWASSRMEGNTYDLLQTEELIRYGRAAEGKDREETLMILNHKAAIQHVVDNLADITLSRKDLFDIHALLASGLLHDPATVGRLRTRPVGISHSSYMPPDDPSTLGEEFGILLHKAAEIQDPYEQSFFLLAHIPYLQGFYDVNKRTSRIATNIPLLQASLAPMSFLAIEDRDYINGLLGIYELNDVSLLREVYVEGYLAAAEKYRILRAEVATPHKAALSYRDLVREAVRHCVLQLQAFRPDAVHALAVEHGVPQADLDEVVAYVGREVKGLHEGNVIRYGLKPEDLESVKR